MTFQIDTSAKKKGVQKRTGVTHQIFVTNGCEILSFTKSLTIISRKKRSCSVISLENNG